MLIEPLCSAVAPTSIPPGPDRVDLYGERYRHGETLFHPDDIREPRTNTVFLTPSASERMRWEPVDENDFDDE